MPITEGPTDEVEKFSHLVSQVSTTGGTEQDAATRLGGKSQNSFEGDRCGIPKSSEGQLKYRIFNCSVKVVLLYASESWTST